MKQEAISVQIHGHQSYALYEGVPLLWCQAVAKFHDEARGSHIKQVPAVILQTAHGPKLVLLQDYLKWSEIKPMREDKPRGMPRQRWWRRLWKRS